MPRVFFETTPEPAPEETVENDDGLTSAEICPPPIFIVDPDNPDGQILIW